MAEIYVTGHRNPDTDSIVAAIAYANLRNALGDRDYKAVRIGEVNDETQHMLERFGFEAPEYIKTMRTQICDLDFDRPPALDSSVTVDLAWRTLRQQKLSVLPITNEDGTLFGMLSSGDIASYDMENVYNSHMTDLPLFNLISVLEGQLINDYSNTVSTVSGEVRLAIPQCYDDLFSAGTDSIILCGNQPDTIREALEKQVNCLILCQAEIRSEWAEMEDCHTCIISTPLDVRKASRILIHAMPVKRVSTPTDLVCFHLTDFVDDVKEIMLESRYRSYPVLDEKEKVVGTISRYHLLRPNRKKVVLVDHNEVSQSVSGLEQVEIQEIIDHHRLADIQTGQPIQVRNEPVGSTCTIITSMYQENGVIPSPRLAGLMAAAILSDTVIFKSPTCTKRDKAMAERLARIAHISLEDLGNDLFTSDISDDRSAEELLRVDFKQFHISDHNIGVSQVTCIDSCHLLERKTEFIEALRQLKKTYDLDMAILMVTDILLDGSMIVYQGSDDVIRQAFNAEPMGNIFFMPGMMSRKKQLIPAITSLWG